MTPQELLLQVFCLVDDELQALNLGRLRQRGPQPKLADSEVITIELAGEFWKLGSLAQATGTGDAQGRTAVKTQWFALRVDAAVGDARVQERALIDATQLPPRLVSRQWGEQS